MDDVFVNFYKKEWNSMLIWAKWKYPNVDYMEDILQETFLRFGENYYSEWDSTLSSLKTYFTNYFVMSMSNSYKAQKKKRLREVSLDATIVDSFDGLTSFAELFVAENPNEDTVSFEEIMTNLNKVIANFNAVKKEELTYLILWIEGNEYKKIAEIKGVNLSYVKNVIHNIRGRINKDYSELTNTKSKFKKVKKIYKRKQTAGI